MKMSFFITLALILSISLAMFGCGKDSNKSQRIGVDKKMENIWEIDSDGDGIFDIDEDSFGSNKYQANLPIIQFTDVTTKIISEQDIITFETSRNKEQKVLENFLKYSPEVLWKPTTTFLAPFAMEFFWKNRNLKSFLSQKSTMQFNFSFSLAQNLSIIEEISNLKFIIFLYSDSGDVLPIKRMQCSLRDEKIFLTAKIPEESIATCELSDKKEIEDFINFITLHKHNSSMMISLNEFSFHDKKKNKLSFNDFITNIYNKTSRVLLYQNNNVQDFYVTPNSITNSSELIKLDANNIKVKNFKTTNSYIFGIDATNTREEKVQRHSHSISLRADENHILDTKGGKKAIIKVSGMMSIPSYKDTNSQRKYGVMYMKKGLELTRYEYCDVVERSFVNMLSQKISSLNEMDSLIKLPEGVIKLSSLSNIFWDDQNKSLVVSIDISNLTELEFIAPKNVDYSRSVGCIDMAGCNGHSVSCTSSTHNSFQSKQYSIMVDIE